MNLGFLSLLPSLLGQLLTGFGTGAGLSFALFSLGLGTETAFLLKTLLFGFLLLL